MKCPPPLPTRFVHATGSTGFVCQSATGSSGSSGFPTFLRIFDGINEVGRNRSVVREGAFLIRVSSMSVHPASQSGQKGQQGHRGLPHFCASTIRVYSPSTELTGCIACFNGVGRAREVAFLIRVCSMSAPRYSAGSTGSSGFNTFSAHLRSGSTARQGS